MEGFRGSPRRICNRDDYHRNWGQVVEFCEGIAVLDQIKAHSVLVIIPFVLFLLLVILAAVATMLRDRQRKRAATLQEGDTQPKGWDISQALTTFVHVYYYIFSLLTFMAYGLFLQATRQVDQTMNDACLILLGYFLFSNVCILAWFCLNLTYQGSYNFGQLRRFEDWALLVALLPFCVIETRALRLFPRTKLWFPRYVELARFNPENGTNESISESHVRRKREQIHQLISSIGLTTFYFRDLPMACLQLVNVISVNYFPQPGLLSVSLAICQALFTFSEEIYQWWRQRKADIDVEILSPVLALQERQTYRWTSDALTETVDFLDNTLVVDGLGPKGEEKPEEEDDEGPPPAGASDTDPFLNEANTGVPEDSPAAGNTTPFLRKKSSVSSKVAKPSEDDRFLQVFLYITFPIVAVSVIPHVLSIIGIPYASLMLRRFRASMRRTPLLQSNPIYRTNWYSRRGVFLFVVNCLGFAITVFLMLPLITLIALVLKIGDWALYFLGRSDTLAVSPAAKFQKSSQTLIGIILWCYLPQQQSPYTIPFKPNLTNVENNLFKFLAGCWFLGFDIVLPVLSIATNFLLYNDLIASLVYVLDPSHQDDLEKYIRIALAASIIGLVLETTRFVSEAIQILVKENRTFQHDGVWKTRSIMDQIVERTPFGHPYHVPARNHYLRLLNVIGEDLLQVLVAMNTLSYVGKRDQLWTFRIVTSTFLLCFNLGKVLTHLVFGTGIRKKARFAFQVLYLVFFGIFALIVSTKIIHDDYCNIARQVSRPVDLAQLCGCSAIGAEMTITHLQEPFTGDLLATEINADFSVTDVSMPLSLIFRVVDVNNSIVVENTAASMNLSLTSVHRIHSTGSVSLRNISDMVALTMATIGRIDVGGSLVLSDLQGFPDFELLGLFVLYGNVRIARTSIELLSLGSLFTVKQGAVLQINGNSALQTLLLPSIYEVTGVLLITHNPRLERLDLSSLSACPGRLRIADNEHLQEVFFGSLGDNGVDLEITNNTALWNASFDGMQVLTGNLTLDHNPSLVSLNFTSLTSADSVSMLTITNNPSLTEIDVRNLDCETEFKFVILSNPSLTRLFLSSVGGCERMILLRDTSPTFERIFD